MDPVFIDRLVEQVRDARIEELAQGEIAKVASNLKQFGLDSPAVTVTLFEKDGNRQWKLNLGNVTLGEEKAVVYVTSSDKPKEAMAVKKVLLDNLFKGVTELRAKELLTDSALNVMYVRLDAAGKDPVILEQTDHQKWRFQKPPYG